MTRTPYLKVILNSDAEIVHFDCSLYDLTYASHEVIGKNWFEMFIDKRDIEQVSRIFKDLFQDEVENPNIYKHDIVCRDGSFRLMDFNEQLFEKDGDMFLHYVGVEHFENQNDLLHITAKALVE